VSWAKVQMIGDPAENRNWAHHNNGSQELPAAGDIVELDARVPGSPHTFDPRRTVPVRVLHRVWHNDNTVSLVCEQMR